MTVEEKNINVFTPMGFGDYLMCYGIIKEFSKKYDTVGYYTHKYYHYNVSRLYSSIPNVKILLVELNDKNKFVYPDDCLYIGVFNPDATKKIDERYYDQVNILIEKKWDNFYFKRDTEKEKHIFYDILKLRDDEPFIFIHEDKNRNMIINKSYLSKDIKTIINLSDYPHISILDFLYVVEKSKEVHVMNSSIVHFIDLMNISHDKLFYHRFLKGHQNRSINNSQFIMRLNWKEV